MIPARFLVLAALALALGGCASAGGPDVPAAAPEPPPPAKQPFEPPSYDATAWHHDELGFSVHYPSDFQEQTGEGVLTVASPAMAPRMDVSIIPAGEGLSTDLEVVGERLVAGFKEIGGGEATVTEAKETTLQDGVSPAMEFVVDWQFQGAIPLQSVVLMAPAKDGGAVNVTVTNMAGGDLDELREMAYTLYFD